MENLRKFVVVPTNRLMGYITDKLSADPEDKNLLAIAGANCDPDNFNFDQIVGMVWLACGNYTYTVDKIRRELLALSSAYDCEIGNIEGA